MKKLIIFLSIILFLQEFLLSQNQKKLILTGFEFGGRGIIYNKNLLNSPKDLYWHTFQFTPKVGVFLTQNFMIAIQAGRNYTISNFIPKNNFPTIYSAGFIARYYFSKNFEKKFLINKKQINLSLLPYIEYNHLFTNHFQRDSGQFTNSGKRLDYQVINPNIGCSLKIGKYFTIDFGYRVVFYYAPKDNTFKFDAIGSKLGFEYLIYKKNRKNEKNNLSTLIF